MAKVKTFVGHTVFAPPEWCEASGAPSHVRQINVLVLAYSKADVTALFEDRLGPRSGAERFAEDLRLVRGSLGNSWRDAIECGAVDPEMPGVYLTQSGGRLNDTVVRVDPDGTYVTVATWLDNGLKGIQRRMVCTPTPKEHR